jgi:hypothetical protein
MLVAKFFRIFENLFGVGFKNYPLSHRDGLKIAKITLNKGKDKIAEMILNHLGHFRILDYYYQSPI